MLKVINTKYWLYSDTFKILLKEEDVEKAIENAASLIRRKVLQLLENITVYPFFCNKDQLAEELVHTLTQKIEKNRCEIKEKIEEMFNTKDPLGSIFRYIAGLLKREEEETEEKYQEYMDYILNSDFPVDFLDDMLMAHHYISKYYRACQERVYRLRVLYASKFRSRRYRYRSLVQKILSETSAYLEDLENLLVTVQTIELFITIWSAKNYEEIIKGEVEWSFHGISENKDATREFQILSWELKEAIRKVRRTNMILKYGRLSRRPVRSEKETRALWDDLLLSMS